MATTVRPARVEDTPLWWDMRAKSRRRRSGGGRAQGCAEFGSDALVDNLVSADAHRALGFEEVVTVRCFRKDLR